MGNLFRRKPSVGVSYYYTEEVLKRHEGPVVADRFFRLLLTSQSGSSF